MPGYRLVTGQQKWQYGVGPTTLVAVELLIYACSYSQSLISYLDNSHVPDYSQGVLIAGGLYVCIIGLAHFIRNTPPPR